MTMYTSLKFSKKLKEAGCELESYYHHMEYYCNLLDYKMKEVKRKIDLSAEEEIDYEIIAPAYDIANDILIQYAKEFFGEDLFDNKGNKAIKLTEEYKKRWKLVENYKVIESKSMSYFCGKEHLVNKSDKITQRILAMLQQDKPQEDIEAYIEENSIFFKNKEKNKKNTLEKG